MLRYRDHGLGGVVALATAAALLGSCSLADEKCVSTQTVRVELAGKRYALPAAARPHIFNDDGAVKGLPNRKIRDDRGQYIYCQSPARAPAQATSIVFDRRAVKVLENAEPELSAVTILVVSDIGFSISPSKGYPVENVAGFTVTHVKPADQIYSPPGGVLPGALWSACNLPVGAGQDGCRVRYNSPRGVGITLDVRADVPLTRWPALLSKVDDFVGNLEVK